MLTKRPLLLTTFLGLCASSLATAQTTTAATGLDPTDILSWLAGGLAAVVLIFGVMTATSLAAAAAKAARPETPAATPEETTAPASATNARIAA